MTIFKPSWGLLWSWRRAWLRRAATLAHVHALSFYDASWAAAAAELGIPLISADRRLLAAGLAESPSEIATRLRLTLN